MTFSAYRRSALSIASLPPIVLLAALVCGCSQKPASAPQTPAVPVKIATAERRDVPVQFRTIGNVESYSTVSVRAQVGGILRAVHFQEGQIVKKGQPLFTIDSSPFEASLAEARARLAKDRALSQNAESDVARYNELAAKGEEYVTKQLMDQVRTNAASAKETVKADEASVRMAEISLGYSTITAPITGRAGALQVHAGNLVKANDETPLVVLLQTRPVFVSFAVPERYLPEIQKVRSEHALKVSATIPGSGADARTGEVTFLDNTVDSTTGTIRLKATFPNDDEALWPGQFVNVILTLSTQTAAIVVPSQAVQTGQQGQFVFIVKADRTVESRPVVVSRTIEDRSVIGSGIAEGETVVTDGQLRLSPGTRIEVKTS